VMRHLALVRSWITATNNLIRSFKIVKKLALCQLFFVSKLF